MYGNPLNKIGQTLFVGFKYKFSKFTKVKLETYNINKIANIMYGEIKTGHNYYHTLKTYYKLS